MIYVFIGIQGSGKGTQAEMLCVKKGFQHVNLGDLFRSHISSKTEIGNEASSYISRGHLVPDEVVFKVIESVFEKYSKGMVMDGFPRTLQQAEYLDKKLKVDRVIYLELADKIAMERMLARRLCSGCGSVYNLLSKKPLKNGICDNCGKELIKRADDNEEAIKNRIKLFHVETQPLTDYFKNLGLLTVISADGDIEVINQNIVKALGL